MKTEIRYGINAIRELLRATGRTPGDIFTEGFDPRDVDFGLSIIWAGLLWQNRDLTVVEVGDFCDEQDGRYVALIGEATEKLIAAFRRSFGLKDDEESEGKN